MALKDIAFNFLSLPEEYQSIENDLNRNLLNELKEIRDKREQLSTLNEKSNGLYGWYANKLGINLKSVNSILIIFANHLENLFPFVKDDLPQILIDLWNDIENEDTEAYKKNNVFIFMKYYFIYKDDVEKFKKFYDGEFCNIEGVIIECGAINILKGFICPEIEGRVSNNDTINWKYFCYVKSASLYGRINIVKYLLGKISNLEQYKCMFQSYLFEPACKSGNLELVKYIFNFCEISGWKCSYHNELSDVIEEGHLHILKYIDEKSNIPPFSQFLNKAIYYGHFHIIKYFVEEKEIEITDECIATSYWKNNNAIIKYLRMKSKRERCFDGEFRFAQGFHTSVLK